jgi:Uma2 family endonuclease
MSGAMQSVPRPPRGDELVYSDGEPMESERHVLQMVLLIESLRNGWRDRTDFYVAGNMLVYFSETQAKKNDFRGPDVFVVMNTTRRERKSWVVWEEDGKTPDVVVELLSESTEAIDRGEKMRVYARQLRVGEYFLFDPFSGVLEGYELDAPGAKYRPKKVDSSGRFFSERTGLFLGKVRGTIGGVDADWLRWIEPSGRVLPTGDEMAAAAKALAMAETARADAETARADAETARADAEAKRVRELEAEIRKLRGE